MLGSLPLKAAANYATYIFHRGDELILFGERWVSFADFCSEFPHANSGNFRIKAFCGPPDDLKFRLITPAKLLLDWYLWACMFKSEGMVKIRKDFEGLLKARKKTLVV